MKKLVSLSGSLSRMWLKGQCRAGARAKNTLVAAHRAEFRCKRQHTSRGKQIFFSLSTCVSSSPSSAASNYLAHNNESKRLLLQRRPRPFANPLRAASNFSAAYLGIISMGLIKSHRSASTVKLFLLASFKIPMSASSQMAAAGFFFRLLDLLMHLDAIFLDFLWIPL